MPLNAVVNGSIRRLLSGAEKSATRQAAAADTRKVARRVFDTGGAMAKDVLGLKVTGVRPTVRVRGARAGALPVEERVLENHLEGHRREKFVEKLLRVLFPKEENYRVYREQYLRTKDGAIAIDKQTHASRRIDFVVFRGKKVVRSLEVTSERVDKAAQLAKETHIRAAGGGYLLDPESHKTVKVPAALKTRVVRLA